MILKTMRQVCKCHGVSGSCSVKVCWKVMPEFRTIAHQLLNRYNQASHIKETKPAAKRVQKLLILNRRSAASSTSDSAVSTVNYKDNLVFLDKSPNFCKRDKYLDTVGTHGRICSLTTEAAKASASIDSCEYLCCGRGYYSKVVETEEECECEFQWCCSVKCKKCKKKVVQYFCN
jgi:hypothetical protein